MIAAGEPEPMQRVPRGRTRSCLTHVAFICDNPDVQRVLPQIIIGNEATFLASAFPLLYRSSPGNVKLIRQKSAWNNELLCAVIIRMLAAALRPYTDKFQPILLLDAVRIHTAKAVLAACLACHIWPIVVPAKTTWLLQPLDTHAFQQFKVHLRRAYQNARISAGRSDLDIGQFLEGLYD